MPSVHERNSNYTKKNHKHIETLCWWQIMITLNGSWTVENKNHSLAKSTNVSSITKIHVKKREKQTLCGVVSDSQIKKTTATHDKKKDTRNINIQIHQLFHVLSRSHNFHYPLALVYTNYNIWNQRQAQNAQT